MEQIISMGKIFGELADICNKISTLKGKEDAGEDIAQESEALLGRFFVKLMELEQLKSAL